MKKLFGLLMILTILLVSCSYLQKGENATTSQSKNTKTSSETNVNTNQLTAGMTCSDADGDDKNVKGKAVMTYSSGQKESFNDYCPEKDEEAFKMFVVEYTCDGNKPKENLRKCDNNMTCARGVCV